MPPPLELQSCDGDVLVGGLMLELKSVLGTETRVDVHLAGGSCLLYADPDRLQGILRDLVRFAANHSDEKPRILLRTETMAEKNQTRILVQARPLSEIPIQPGTFFSHAAALGLVPDRLPPDLATMANLIRKMSGTFGASLIGTSGIEFSITLPRLASPSLVKHESDSKPNQTSLVSKLEVLVCEDNEAVRLGIQGLLKASGFSSHVEETAEATLAYAARTRSEIAVLISDIRLPGMDGRELSMRLREANPRLEVILISGSSHGVVSKEWLRQENVNFLPKPFTHAQLVQAVTESMVSYRPDP